MKPTKAKTSLKVKNPTKTTISKKVLKVEKPRTENAPTIVPAGKGRENSLKNLKQPWKKGQSGNPKGSTPRIFSTVINELKEKGYTRVTQGEFLAMSETLMSMDEEQIHATINDKKNPLSIRIVAKALAGPRGPEMIERLLDRAHGKAKQVQEFTGEIKSSELSPEKKAKIQRLLSSRLGIAKQ